MKLFCRHQYILYNELYVTHFWSVEETPTNKIYRYEYSICGVICTKCDKRVVNHKMKLLDHGDRYSKQAQYIIQDF